MGLRRPNKPPISPRPSRNSGPPLSELRGSPTPLRILPQTRQEVSRLPRRPSTGGLLTPGGSRPEKPRGPQMRRPQSRHAWNLRFAPRPITPPRNVAHSWSGSSTMAPASVIIIGDSNVSYSSTRRQPSRWVSQHSCGTFQFPPMVEILQRLAPCPVAYVPLPQLRVLHNISLTLQMTAHTLPKPCTAHGHYPCGPERR